MDPFGYDPYAPPLGMFRPGMEPWLPQGMQQSQTPRGVGGVPAPYDPQRMGSFFGRPAPPPPDPVDTVTDEILERLFAVGELQRPNPDFGPRKSRGAKAHKEAWSPKRTPPPRTTPYDMALSQFGGTGRGENYTGPQATPPEPQLGSAFGGPQPGQSVSPGVNFGAMIPEWLRGDARGAAPLGANIPNMPWGQWWEDLKFGATGGLDDPQRMAAREREQQGQPGIPVPESPYPFAGQRPEPAPAPPGRQLPNITSVGDTMTPGSGLPRGPVAAPSAAPPPGMMLPDFGSDKDVEQAIPRMDDVAKEPPLPDPTRLDQMTNQPPAAKSSLLEQIFTRMADALPGALVAFAADRANSPEIAQQYTEMKRRELAEVQENRRNEIAKMGHSAEMWRHLNSMEMQRLDMRFNIEQHAAELQKTIGVSDPYAYSKAIQSLGRTYAVVGGDAPQLAEAFPFMQNELFSKFRKDVFQAAKDNKPENYNMAVVPDPWNPGQMMSIARGLQITNGYDGNKVIMPVGLHTLDTFTNTNQAGVTSATLMPQHDMVGQTAIRHPQPPSPTLIQTIDPRGGTIVTPVTGYPGGGMSVGQPGRVRGNQPGVGGMVNQMQVQSELIPLVPIAREYLSRSGRFGNRLPTTGEVNEWLTVPENFDAMQEIYQRTNPGATRGR